MAIEATPYNPDLGELYDRMWADAVGHFGRDGVQTDPHLLDRDNDRRQGLTVIARPSQAVKHRIAAMLNELRQIAPDQYFYRAEELHTTVLSLFTATADFEPYLANRPAFEAVASSALTGAKRFSLAYRGVSASRGAIMVQGFPLSSYLDQLRTELRQALRSRGLGAGLDQRYTIRTAHATVMRFRTQPRNLPKLVDVLSSFRSHSFGQTTVATLQLVKNDWYMSTAKVEVLAEYELA